MQHAQRLAGITALACVLGGGWGQAARVLPTQYTGMQAADAALNGIGPKSPVAQLADRQGIRCNDFRYFTYENATQASQGLNDWLKSAGFTATAVATDGHVTSEWKAVKGTDYLYGFWRAMDVDSPKGTLQLCSGTAFDVAARDAERADASRQIDAMYRHQQQEPSQPHFRIPLWAIIALGSGLAGGAVKSIHKNPFSPDE